MTPTARLSPASLAVVPLSDQHPGHRETALDGGRLAHEPSRSDPLEDFGFRRSSSIDRFRLKPDSA